MKAYNVYPGDDPYYSGSCLVYADSRNRARVVGWHAQPWWGADSYIDFHGIRVPEFDEFCVSETPYAVLSNDDLPKSAPDFYDDKLY